MVEASIAWPIIALTVALLLRLFTFYIEILYTGVKAHEEALAAWDAFNKPILQVYESTERVTMLTGGLLSFDPHKDIRTKAYLLNEDGFVRAREILHE